MKVSVNVKIIDIVDYRDDSREKRWSDPIIDELHKIREEHAKKFNYDIAAICEDLKKGEKKLEEQGFHLVGRDKAQPTLES